MVATKNNPKSSNMSIKMITSSPEWMFHTEAWPRNTSIAEEADRLSGESMRMAHKVTTNSPA
jgi:hypothetical protein